MTAGEVYGWLIASEPSSRRDAFDRHVVAAIVAVAAEEAEASGQSLLDGLGLTRKAFLDLCADFFPGAVSAYAERLEETAPRVDAEEQSIRDIMDMYRTGANAFERQLLVLIARRCQAPHHLWQDLGLNNRGELGELMRRHFAPLAKKNSGDMKWKKFLYRMVCGSEGFTLCTSPVCAECDDFQNCFGNEDGESRLAWMRNAPGGVLPKAAMPKPAAAPAGPSGLTRSPRREPST